MASAAKRLDYVRALLVGQSVVLTTTRGLSARGLLVRAGADGSYTIRFPAVLVRVHGDAPAHGRASPGQACACRQVVLLIAPHPLALPIPAAGW